MSFDTKALKNRIKSVDSTLHLTKAMGLVASSKIRKANKNMAAAGEYRGSIENIVSLLSSSRECRKSPFLKDPEGDKTLLIVIAGDRGLAGGYNSNVFRMVQERAGDQPYCVIPVGKKALEYFRKIGVEIVTEDFAVVSAIDLAQCSRLGKRIAEGFRTAQYDEVWIVYTDFVSMLVQQPDEKKLLPLTVGGTRNVRRGFILYEPSCSGVFNQIIPEYLAGMAYGAICESYASELAARRTAMDSATKNASDMIDSLSLQYNRARQSAITQEITEIVAGSA